MAKPIQQRKEELRLKMARDKLRLARLDGQAKEAERKRDTRRKIVIGAAVMSEIERDPRFADVMKRLLNKAVIRLQDREVIAYLLPPTVAEERVAEPAAETKPGPETTVSAEPPSPAPDPTETADATAFAAASSSFGPRPKQDWRSRFDSHNVQTRSFQQG